MQELLQRQFFSDPTECWDNRWSKPTPQHPDFEHKESKIALWLNNRDKPAWVDLQLATWYAGMMKRTPGAVTSSVQGQYGLSAHEDHLEVGMCRKLCEDGRINEAVDSLTILVQRGRHVPSNLFFHLLKGCIADNDLVLGSHIHALSVESGYEGDDFLATHFIGLYASHGRLKEAMGVFIKVSTPSRYSWATIIFAFAKNGDGAQAIRLYRQMRQSPVKPDNRIYVAVLKACASAGDLGAGKEVHAHILASPAKPDNFVRTGLLDMYAKCGSLDEARIVFDQLPVRNTVTWNAMLAGYAQHGMGQEALSLYDTMLEEGLSQPNRVTFVCLLQACAGVGVGALHEGRKLYTQIEEQGLHDDVVLGCSLVNMYAKCGSLEDARRVFDGLPVRNVVTWNAMLAGYTQNGMGQEALSLYSTMQQESLAPLNPVTYISLLQACAIVGVGALYEGKHLHAKIEEQGLQDDVVLGCSLLNMYAKCGSLEDARSVFDRLPDRDVVTWNAMLAGYSQKGMGQDALELYGRMQLEGIFSPDSVTFVCLLQACASVGVAALSDGRKLHAQIEERELQHNLVLGGSLVNMYARCGSVEDARRVFDKLPDRNVVTWTAMILGYALQGMGQEALTLYSNMQQEGLSPPDSVTFISLLQACASVGVGGLHHGKQLHAQINEQRLQGDVVLTCSLVNMYAKCSSIEDARSLFDRLSNKNIVTWNALLAGYAQQGLVQEAFSLYTSMLEEGLSSPDCVTFISLLQSCASVGVTALLQGKQLHADIKERGLQDDVVLGGSLVNMYVKCGAIQDARSLFDSLPDKTMVTWNAMLAGYMQRGMGEEALALYNNMQQEGLCSPNSVTYMCLLQACAIVGVAALHEGKQLHAQITDQGLEDDVVVGSSLVSMYVKCGRLEDARSVFDRLPDRDVLTWNAMLAGYAEPGMVQEALSLYSGMKQEGVTPNSFTFVCLLQACAIVACLPLGKQLHAQIEEHGMQADVVVGGALVNMYAKCGSMFDSQQVFDSLPERSMEAWAALIGGYTRHGDSGVVFELLERMSLEGMLPTDIIFLSVLTVCSHAGLVDKGRKYFEVMMTDYGLTPTVEHFTCMMDLLGRAGHLDEALEMAKTMPISPDGIVWNTLLGACQKWNDVEIGQQAFEFAVRLDGKDAAPYVLMSNIYARAQMWEEAKVIQARRVKCGAWKEPGQSWCTDIGGSVHTFVAGDKTHPDSDGIYAGLEHLVPKWKKEEYLPLDSPLRDITNFDKEPLVV